MLIQYLYTLRSDDRILSWENYRRRKAMLFKEFLLFLFNDDDEVRVLWSDKSTQLKFFKYVGIRKG